MIGRVSPLNVQVYTYISAQDQNIQALLSKTRYCTCSTLKDCYTVPHTDFVSSPDIDSLHLCPLSDTQTVSDLQLQSVSRTEPRELHGHQGPELTRRQVSALDTTGRQMMPNSHKKVQRLPFVSEKRGAQKAGSASQWRNDQ